ncbi:hypothetical protein F4777DRAFT_537969 [Nemania sp. FL0916]|nr:hypothetical protein F4777DRAFT_537969 [Nemania sp. FL0916]
MSVPGPTYVEFNPFPSHEVPGYDILVSLSQKKLQEQLQRLYDTPLPSISHPPPGTTQNVVQPDQYLISHRLRLLLPRTSKKNPTKQFSDTEREGLLGYILCPEISLVDGKYRTVKLKFTFTAAPEGTIIEGTYKKDSVLQQLEDGETYDIPINGWTFSFEADLSTSKPMNIMNDILKLANNPEHPVVIPEKTKASFQDLADITAKDPAVDSRTFLASSIFCLFQSTQIANSFEVTNEKGSKLGVEDFNTINTFAKTVSTYFTTLKSSNLPTTQNPFVLGYAITQELPKLSSITTHTTDKTPKYFIPRRYDISVTPPPAGFGVPGSLNFCLQTFRDKAEDQVDIDITKTASIGCSWNTPAQNIVPGGKTANHDGVMVVSKRIFLDRFALNAFNPTFYLNPAEIVRSLGSNNPYDVTSNKEYFDAKGSTWTRTHTVEGGVISKRNNIAQVLLQQPKCASKLVVEVSSDWSNALKSGKTSEMKSDSLRQVYLTITTEAITTVIHKAEADVEGSDLLNGLKGLIMGALGNDGSFESLPLHHEVTVTQRYKYIFKLTAGNAGAWSVEKHADSVLPTFKNDGKELEHERVYDDVSSSKCGTFVRIEKGTVQGAFEDAFKMDEISEKAGKAGVAGGVGVVKEVAQKLQDFCSTFKTTIMLPAGDAFMFKDLDTDSFGNLYSNINYGTIQDGKVIHQPLK